MVNGDNTELAKLNKETMNRANKTKRLNYKQFTL